MLPIRHILLALLIAGTLAAEQPPVEALKIDRPPKLDGKLDEPFWRTAKSLGEFQLWDDADKGKRTSDTDIRLAYDNAWLYIGVRRDNPLQKLVLAPKTNDHDGPIQQDESIEFFMTADPKGRNYYHFMLSCFNIKAEQRFLNGARERESWNLPWRSATAIGEKGWTAEIAIPLCLFLEYGDFRHLRMNVARNQRHPFRDSCDVITHETMEHALWRPVAESFHEIEAFAAVAPPKPDKLQVPFLASLESAEIKPYFLKDGKNHYRVDLSLKGGNMTPGETEAVVTDRPAGGPTTAVRQRVAVSGTTARLVSIDVPAPSPAERVVTVELRDIAGGESLQSLIVENPSCLKIMSAYLDRDYYTTETDAIAVAEIAMPEENLKGMSVAVTLGGKVLGTAPATSETRVPFPVSASPVGEFPVTVALRRADGAAFGSVAITLIKRAPKPGREVKIDQINRVVLKDGEPFFPFCPVMGYPVAPTKEEDFKIIADAGCDAFMQFNHHAKDAAAYLPVAKKYGLQVIALLENGWPRLKDAGLKTPNKLLSADEAAKILADDGIGSLSIRGHMLMSKASHPAKTAVFEEYFEKGVPVTEKNLAAMMNADNLLAYNSFDEPGEDAYFNVTKSLNALYRLTKRVDGYHPLMVLYSSYIPKGDEYVAPCDILCADPYWVPGGDTKWTGRNTPNFVSKIVHWNDRRAEKLRKVVWTVPTASTWSNCRKRGLSGAEVDCQNFLAIIHGSRGLFWFCYPMREVAWNNLKKSITKIRVVGPMAVQPKVAQTVRYRRAPETTKAYVDAPFVPEKEEFPDVQGRIFRDPKGGLVLLATNSRYYPITATVTVEGLAGEVEEVFSGAKTPVKDDAFSEKLEPFAIRAWRLGAALKEPVALTVASLLPSPIPSPETSHLDNVRDGKKNVFPNPSLEEETIPGAADYYFGDGGALVTDPKIARFGKKCLRLSHGSVGGYAQIYWSCYPRHDKDTAYVWSFWAKGAKGGERVWVNDGKTFELTPEWKRYESPVIIPARSRPWEYFNIRLWRNGTAQEAWFDGFQLEQGRRATEFEE